MKKTKRFLATALLLLATPFSASGVLSQDAAVTAQSVETASKRLPILMQKLTADLAVLPGASVAIVYKDKVVFEGGFGTIDVDGATAFTATTPTYIASGSKAFLGLAIADMANRGEIDVHAPIGSTYLADLDQNKLGAFGLITLHQLLTHTHGINGDAVGFRTAYTGDMTAENLWRIAGLMPPSESGNDFDYSNFGYVAAGYVLQHHLGLPWQDIIDRYVFEKLGMHQSTARVSDLVEQDFAKPHIWYGKIRRIPLFKRDASMHPAGGHFSTAKDMSRWLTANMNSGNLEGAQVFSPNAIKDIQAPHAALNKSFFTYNRTAHGYGWYTADYQGQTLLHHFGSFSGYRAHISFMPDHDLGVIVLSNDLSRPTITLPDLIANFVYDTALTAGNTNTVYDEKLAELEKLIAPVKGKELPVRPTNAPDDVTGYVSDFVHPTWGEVSFLDRNGTLIMRWGQSESEPTWTTRDGTTYLRVEIAGGSGYLLTPEMDEHGSMTAFMFNGIRFQR